MQISILEHMCNTWMRRVLCTSVSERDATSNPMAVAIEFDMLEASLQETDEDHLGVTLIRSGDSVIIRMRLSRYYIRVVI